MPRPLTLRYVRVSGLSLWPGNPKRHSLDDIQESIRRHGFRDPPAFDATLDAIVDGNGRGEALQAMEAAEEELPKGLATDKQGRWLAPVVFGLDAESAAAAEAYGLDANSLTLGPGFDVADVSRLYDADDLSALCRDWGENGDGFDGLVLDFRPAPGEEPEPPDGFPSVDETLPTEHACPECGYKWSGSA